MRRRAPAPGTRSAALPGTTAVPPSTKIPATRNAPPVARGNVGRPVEAAAFQLPKVGPIPAGWRIIGGREFTEQLLSIRFVVLIVILGVTGVGLTYVLSGNIQQLAGQIQDQLTTYTGQRFPLFLLLFSGTGTIGSSGPSLPSFATLVTVILGPLLGLAFGFDAISNERSEGTLPRLVSQPIHRDDVINGKFAASLSIIGLIVGAVIVILAGVGILRLGVVPSGDSALRLVSWFAFLVLYVAFWLALSMLFSVVFRRAATALLAVLAIWLVVSFFGSTIVGIIASTFSPIGAANSTADQLANANLQDSLMRLLPTGQFSDITTVLLNPSQTFISATVADPTGRAIPSLLPVTQSLLLVWPQIVTLVGFTIGCFALAYVIFLRQEVRA
jgi:ABC-2 type transport system permease protein